MITTWAQCVGIQASRAPSVSHCVRITRSQNPRRCAMPYFSVRGDEVVDIDAGAGWGLRIEINPRILRLGLPDLRLLSQLVDTILQTSGSRRDHRTHVPRVQSISAKLKRDGDRAGHFASGHSRKMDFAFGQFTPDTVALVTVSGPGMTQGLARHSLVSVSNDHAKQ